MSHAFKSIERGLNQAIKHATKKAKIARIHEPQSDDMKKISQNRGRSLG